MNVLKVILAFTINNIVTVTAAPQPQVNTQFNATQNNIRTADNKSIVSSKEIYDNRTEENEIGPVSYILSNNINNFTRRTEINAPQDRSFYIKIYKAIVSPIVKIMSVPKVRSVLRNLGTCAVNGALEIITYYLPSPLIPLIAAAAGMVIPFEPVVMLRDRMPVTSYRRAFQTALQSFLNTFSDFTVNNENEDPYMTRRFNRRFLNDIPEDERHKKSHKKDRFD